MNSKSLPTVVGAQYPGRSPSGTNTAPKRRTGAAAVLASAVRAGTIESRNGSAIGRAHASQDRPTGQRQLR